MNLTVRRAPGLDTYDFANEGAYFVTLTVYERAWLGE